MNTTLTLRQFEKLDGAQDALLRAGDFMTTDDPRGWIGKFNRLLDAAIDCGMPFDHDDVTGWVAERVTRELCAA